MIAATAEYSLTVTFTWDTHANNQHYWSSENICRFKFDISYTLSQRT